MDPKPLKHAVRCVVCAQRARSATGECAFCGSYVCAECGRLHLGPANEPCPGKNAGVPVPQEARVKSKVVAEVTEKMRKGGVA